MRRMAASFPLERSSITDATVFVQNCLETCGVKLREKTKGTLVAEEALGSLIIHGAGNGKVRVAVWKLFGNVSVEMSAPGSEYKLSENMASAVLPMGEDIGTEAQDAIRNILLRSLTDDLRYRHKAGNNFIRMTLFKSKRDFLYKTLFALFAAILAGLLLTGVAPAAFNSALSAYVLTPVKTIYINMLKTVVAPVVFFSIISCIAGFSNLSDLGRIGGRTFALYLVTTVLSVAIGIGVFYLFRPGETSLAVASAAGGSVSAGLSIKDTLIGIVPSNFVEPFLTSNMPQLIFLAVLCGIATGLIGKYSAVLRSLFEACNELFMQIAGMIIRLMPVAVFCSTASMFLDLGVATLLSLAGMFGTFVFGLLCMMAVYRLLLLMVGRLDPRPLVRKYAPVMLQIFSMASSNAAIPINMKACDEKLGIASRVYSLSIPLGATLNMDGTCIQLAVFALALAKVYGVAVPAGALVTLAVTIIILSMGMPGISGAGVICLSVLLQQLHVPTEAVGLVMGIGPLIGMFLSMSNCLGDVVVTTIVARLSGELDIAKYRK